MFGPKDMGYKPRSGVGWGLLCCRPTFSKNLTMVSISEDAIFKFVWVSEDGRHNMKMILWMGNFLYFLGTK